MESTDKQPLIVSLDGDSRADEEARIIRDSLDELRLFFKHITNIYDQLRIKCLALIAGEVAIVTWIFSSGYPFPRSYYIRVLLFGGVACLLVAFGVLLWAISAMEWKIPHNVETSLELKHKYKTEQALLEYLHDDYVGVIRHCLPLITKRSKRVNIPIYLVIIGVTIVLVVKFGG